MGREETQKRIREYFHSREEEMVLDIFRLMRIDSLKSEPPPGMPFGEKCAKVLEEAVKIARALGFPVTNYDNYAVAVDLNDKPYSRKTAPCVGRKTDP
ncbi:MAG: M20 family metallopeptidase [Hungatella sp.]|nr:M20 family metallopeptidase [Hungatella sp.]